MSIKGDMEYYAADITGLTVDQCRSVIKAALEAANDPNFAIRYQREVEKDTDIGDDTSIDNYFALIKFLKNLV